MDPNDNSVTLVPEPKSGLSRKTIFIGIGIAVALLITVVLLIASSQGNSLAPLEQRLAVRMNNLQKLAGSAQQSINNEELANLNSQLSALTISDNSALQSDLKTIGAVGDEYSEEIIASEADTATYTELKQAVVDGNFDQKYVAAITQKIDDISQLMNTIYPQVENIQLRQDIKKAYKDIQFIKKQMLKLKL